MHPRMYKKGDVFGMLTITKPYAEKKGGKWHHEAACKCGGEKLACGNEMKRGRLKSCGCSKYTRTHGMTNRPEYKVWAAMIQRCTNKNNAAFDNYGGRGISVSESWMSFESFISDMGGRPNKDMTIERIDNSKGYSKENCKWDTRFAQSANKRKRKDNKTGCTGVYFSPERGSYSASIQNHGANRFLGSFKTLLEACAARKSAEKALSMENNYE